MIRPVGQKGFTFIEIIIASLILTLLVAAIVQYHSTSGASRGQEYYLKAVQVARSELEKLRALFELDPDLAEFSDNVTASGGLPGNLFLFKFTRPTRISLPKPIFHVYYDDHGFSNEFLSSIGPNNAVKDYKSYYVTAFNNFSATDDIDKRTLTYFTYDRNTETDYVKGSGQVDTSVVVVDDMGNPNDPGDDLLGNIGWWVENVPYDEPDSTALGKKITFVLQFWYPGQDWTRFDPEVIVLKTTVVKP